MATASNTECLFECVLGIKDLIQSPEKEPLEERLEKDGVKERITKRMEENYCGKSKKKKKKTHDSFQRNPRNQNVASPSNVNPNSVEELSESFEDLFVVGQDIATDSIPKFSRFLLERDYREVANFNGFNDGDVGVIVIPEEYIPKKPRIVEPDDADEVIENNAWLNYNEEMKYRVRIIFIMKLDHFSKILLDHFKKYLTLG